MVKKKKSFRDSFINFINSLFYKKSRHNKTENADEDLVTSENSAEDTQRINVKEIKKQSAELPKFEGNIFQRFSQRYRYWVKGLNKGLVDVNGSNPSAIFKPRTKLPNVFLSVIVTTLKLFIVLVFLIAAVGLGAVSGIAQAHITTSPNLDIMKITDTKLSSKIFDMNDEFITNYYGLENREWASIEEIPDMLQKAVIATEDSRFHTHNGIDIKRIVGAFIGNFTSDKVQGGSTITQQLIKNSILTPERSYKRKIQEAYLAMQLERQYTKEQILEVYLNEVSLGDSNFGVKAAAKDYFGKELSELNIRECAMLAAVINNSAIYNPRRNYYRTNTPERINNRTNDVLLKMYREGYITTEEYETELNRQVQIIEESTNTGMYEMPHFIEYLISDVINCFIEQHGLENTQENRNKIENEIRTGGYSIYATVDPEIQRIVEETMYNWKDYPKMRSSADNIYNGIPQPQAAATVYDYRLGQIRAIVGARQAPTAKKLPNRAVIAQPIGSSIKPIAVYAPAVDKYGFGCGTIINNIPGPITGWDSETGFPYQGGRTGAVTMRQAIISSLNVAAAKTLLELPPDGNGIKNSIEYLSAFGVDTNPALIKETPSGLALGTNAISSFDLTVAFGTIANKGVYITPVSFTKVLDSKGKVLLDSSNFQQKIQVLKPSTAWMLIDMLTDAVNKGTGTPARIPGMTIAGKTGTNDNYRGISFSGISPYYSSAIWIGSDNYQKMQFGGTGGREAAPIFQAYMSQIHNVKNLSNKKIIEDSPESLGLRKYKVCPVSGKAPTDACYLDHKHPIVEDWFLMGTQPTEPCDMHVVVDVCSETGKLASERCTDVHEESRIFIPKNSDLQVVSDADLQQYLPDYTRIDPSELNPQNYPDQYCEHTSVIIPLDREAEKAKLLEAINWAQTKLNAHAERMTLAHKAKVTALINNAKAVYNNNAKTASQLRDTATNLQAKAWEVFDLYE